METACDLHKLDLLKRWGVIWEYVIENDEEPRVTIWLTGRASEPVESMLAGILGGLLPRERLQIVRERPPIVAREEGPKLQPAGRSIGASI